LGAADDYHHDAGDHHHAIDDHDHDLSTVHRASQGVWNVSTRLE
jgi:hypothetical protein